MICFSTEAAISSKLADRDPMISAMSRTSVNLKFRAVELKESSHALMDDIPRFFVRSELGINTSGLSGLCNNDVGRPLWLPSPKNVVQF